jgi:hypothetical protein
MLYLLPKPIVEEKMMIIESKDIAWSVFYYSLATVAAVIGAIAVLMIGVSVFGESLVSLF